MAGQWLKVMIWWLEGETIVFSASGSMEIDEREFSDALSLGVDSSLWDPEL